MVDVAVSREYILQWSGHAANMCERFSSLLARQALVDVTLLCQGKKIRVHKLVLASCSGYFEEMLEEDLDPDSTIVLTDLDFNILKAMVEFIYCGETTIAHCHLSSLLNAAQIFKIKDLESLVTSIISPRLSVDNDTSSTLEDKTCHVNSSFDLKTTGVEAPESLSSFYIFEECLRTFDTEPQPTNNELESEEDDSALKVPENSEKIEICMDNLENFPSSEEAIKNSSTAQENGLHEENIGVCNQNMDDSAENSLNCPNLLKCVENFPESSVQNRKNSLLHGKIGICNGNNENSYKSSLEFSKSDEFLECEKNLSQQVKMDIYNGNLADFTKSALNSDENSLNSSNFNESSISSENPAKSLSLSEDLEICEDISENFVNSPNSQNSEDFEENQGSITGEESTGDVSNCQLNLFDSPGSIGECSRVYTHKKRRVPPKRRIPSLKIQKSLPTECIDLSHDKNCNKTPVTLPLLDLETDYVFTLTPENIQREKSICDDLDIHKFAVPNHRSLRQIKDLFSVENRIETTPVLRRSVRLNQLENDDNANNHVEKTREKPLKKMNKIKSIKLERKMKDSQIPDENQKHVMSRPMRSTRKIAAKRTFVRKDKSKKSKVKIKKIQEHDDSLPPLKLNTIASVDRCLWGDMSDLLENAQATTEMPEYSTSKQIPFAVGLLPLRTALERMQATPEHQPRKTRSSVAPYKVEGSNSKRKVNGELEAMVTKQAIEDTTDTVCHTSIHTSSRSCSSTGKKMELARRDTVKSTSDRR